MAAIEKIKQNIELKNPHSLSKKKKSVTWPYPVVKESSKKLVINMRTCGTNKHTLIMKKFFSEINLKLLLLKFAQLACLSF